MPESQSRCEDVPKLVVAVRGGRRRARSRRQLPGRRRARQEGVAGSSRSGESIRDISPQGLVEWAKTTVRHGRQARGASSASSCSWSFVFAALGRLARTSWWGAVARLRPRWRRSPGSRWSPGRPSRPKLLAPVIVGFLAWLVALAVIATNSSATGSSPTQQDGTGRRRGADPAQLLPGRRVRSVVSRWLAAVFGEVFGSKRDAVERARDSLRVDPVTKPVVPRRTTIDVDGVAPWVTPVEEFYLIDTTILSTPADRAAGLGASYPRHGRERDRPSPTTTWSRAR